MTTMHVSGSIPLPIGSIAEQHPDGSWTITPPTGKRLALVALPGEATDPDGSSGLSIVEANPAQRLRFVGCIAKVHSRLDEPIVQTIVKSAAPFYVCDPSRIAREIGISMEIDDDKPPAQTTPGTRLLIDDTANPIGDKEFTVYRSMGVIKRRHLSIRGQARCLLNALSRSVGFLF